MTLRERIYRFGSLDVHAAIIIQRSIEERKDKATKDGSPLLMKGDKAFKAVIEELDQIYDDLDRHIAASVRLQEIKAAGNKSENFPEELAS